MARVFISYKRADKEIVFPLKDKIEAAIGEPCWIDIDGIESDAQFVETIMSAIDEASIMLFMYSRQHARIRNFDTDWTVRELCYAQKTNKRIVFINIDRSPMIEWLSFMFPQQQMIDASSQEDMDRLQKNMYDWLGKNKKEIIIDHYTEGIHYSYNKKTHEAKVENTDEVKESVIAIPTEVKHEGENYTVTSIGSYAFSEKYKIQSIIIPESVNCIEDGAFNKCIKLQSITIPTGVKRIESDTFQECTSLSSVILHEGLEYIGSYAFSDCKSLQYISLPNSVKTIKSYAFNNCIQLKSIGMPSSLTHIGGGAFNGCFHLQYIEIPKGISIIRTSTFSECRQLQLTTIPDNVRWIRWSAFFNCERIRMITIPRKTFVGLWAFDNDCIIIRKK